MIEQQQAIQPLPIDDVRHLPADQWNSTVESAKRSIRESLPEPRLADYVQDNTQELPRWLSVPVVAGVTLLAVLGLFISAGKQLAVADMVFSDLVNVSNRISPLWVSGVLIFLLPFGELGALLFGLFAGIYLRSRLVFRAFSIGSALLALVGNITISASYPVKDAWVYQWLVTIFPPLVVLGVGFAYENMLLTYVEARAIASKQYKAARDIYRTAQRNPERNPAYKNMLFRAVLGALREAQPTLKRKAFDMAVTTDPDFRRTAFLREFAKHSLTVDLEFDETGSPLSVYVETQRQAQTRLPAAESLSAIPAVVSENSVSSGQTDTRQTSGSKRDQALAMLQADPSLASLTTRELEERTGINKSAWSEARRAYGENQS